ncbi:hypothetical protein COLO4_08128 [Corchorus olitorius]|uniref:Uncharacterized protein n=1 Tax=Corchorus olitorius TaxID=93759 RepID=A0A1R3KH71_9ROSI|nr:hypothetical protein COLO4_08128 [Corchorus olitorius]
MEAGEEGDSEQNEQGSQEQSHETATNDSSGNTSEHQPVVDQGRVDSIETPSLTFSPLDFELEPILDLDETRHRLLNSNFDGVEHRVRMGTVLQILQEEHAKFESWCEDLVQQNHKLMEELQRRHFNDPFLQPTDNAPRWINLPEGGILYTNARLVNENGNQEGPTDRAESSRMGELRNRALGYKSPREIVFQVEMEIQRVFNHQEEEERIYRMQCNWLNNSEQTPAEAETNVAADNNSNVEEAAFVDSLLRNELSPIVDSGKKLSEDSQSSGQKRKREDGESETSSGRNLRQRLQQLEMAKLPVTNEEEKEDVDVKMMPKEAENDGLWRADPQQPPREP